jgi:hypothetical protein
MLFLVGWKGSPALRDKTAERFVSTGARPPEGVRMLGRWHEVGRHSGVAVVEADDPMLLCRWALEWSDVFELEVRPVSTDEQMGPLLAQAIGKR